MTENQKLFKAAFPHLDLNFDFSLAKKSYFKIGGPAEIFYQSSDRQEIQDLLVFAYKMEIPFVVLGGLSNVVISDKGLKGLVLVVKIDDFEVLEEEKDEVKVKVGVGVKTGAMVRMVSDLGLTGLEGLIGVPGFLGGAIYNNAHYFDVLVANCIEAVEVFDLEKEEVRWFSKAECDFAYEQSIFQKKNNLVIFSAIFSFQRGDREEIEASIKESQDRRHRKQPLDLPSCGCVFQNPKNTPELKEKFPIFKDKEHIPAGFLIEQAGLKGVREGDIQVSEKHASFFVNIGEGKEQDVKKLAARVKKTVKDKFGVDLHEEVFYL